MLALNAGTADGTGTNARHNNPEGVSVDSLGNAYVADIDGHLIRNREEDESFGLCEFP
jgi:hypothetical protein